MSVLERRTGIDPTLKAGSINQPTAEALRRRGLLPGAAEAQRRLLEQFVRNVRARGEEGASAAPPPKFAGHFAGHFAGIPLRGDLMDTTDPDFAGAGPAGEVGGVLQQDVERILLERAGELDVVLRQGVELTGFDADDDGVTFRTSARGLRTGWLVGCDGGRSLVRKRGGFAFPGTDPEITGRQALVEMTGTEGLRLGWNRTAHGTYAYGPQPGRFHTVEFDGPPADREAPVTREELEKSLRRVSGVDVTIRAVHSATRFTDNARQATDYRAGRVLLAGDAAHVHAPFGGQGLNLGVGDAMNLGWKPAAAVRGDAPEDLLGTYTAERHPVGAWVLRWARAQTALMRAGPACERAARHRRRTDGDGHGHDLLHQEDHRCPAALRPPRRPPAHRPLGARPRLADGTRLADHLHGGRGLLLDLAGNAAGNPAGNPAVTGAARGYEGRVDTLTYATAARGDGPAALLVRPDGIVAWATGEPAGAAGPAGALSGWFGDAA